MRIGKFIAVCEAHSKMQSMSLLGRSGARKVLKNACSEIESGRHKIAMLRTGSESLL